MKKVLIIGDNHFRARGLKKLVFDIDDTIKVCGPIKKVTDVVKELRDNNDYDLIISDIRLNDGDVFEAFRIIKPNALVIFTTAYNESSMQAIRSDGIDDLIRRIDFKGLCDAVEKLNLEKSSNIDTIHNGTDGVLKETFQYRERLLVCRGDELIILYADNINYISIEGGHVHAFTDEGLSYQLSTTMADLEQKLDPNKFLRISRKYIANIKGIKKINLFFNSRLIIKLKGCSDDNIVISKEKTAQLKKWLDR